MVSCSILGCNSISQRKIDNITFYRFPKEANIINMWILAAGRTEWQPEKNDRICSKHFESRYFRKTHKRTYLLPNAIPTLFIPVRSNK
ncbi:unnamed protein product [Parnassius mnemosyne]|uniref:THAP-type domain-containing protein n=1 Tax=Parnassius mnemosyne TaxID=213953 RepID=A0AAV1KRP3_9NEOP